MSDSPVAPVRDPEPAPDDEMPVRTYKVKDGVLDPKSVVETPVAIPSRSWRPIVLKTKTTTRLVIEGEAS